MILNLFSLFSFLKWLNLIFFFTFALTIFFALLFKSMKITFCVSFVVHRGKVNSVKSVVASQKSLSKSNGITCEVCEWLMQELDNKLKGNKTEEAVKKALEEVCEEIPFSKECRSLVDTYSEQILRLVVGELADTHQVCKTLGLCLSAFSEYFDFLCDFVRT